MIKVLRRFGLYSVTWTGAGKTDRRIFLLVMAAHFAAMVWYNSWQSPACDESGYFSYAIRWAKGHPERTGIMDDSKTPMVFPALWSLSLRGLFPSLAENDSEGFISLGRLGMYVYFFLLSFGFFCWSYRLFGAKKWVIPWLLFLTDPLLLSNALLIGSDTASACCMLWAFYFAWRFSVTRCMRYWWLMAIVCGLGLLVKISLVILVPLAGMLAGWAAYGNGNTRPQETIRRKVFRWMALAGICLLIINAGYWFSGTGKPIKEYKAQSERLKQLQANLPVPAAIPLPVPRPYLSSYDLLLRNAEKGGGHTDAHSYHGVFLNGDYLAKGGFSGYYLWHFLYKVPPLLLLALTGTCILLLKKPRHAWARLQHHIFIWLPPLVFMIWLSLANPFQIGLRHALPAWPFLYLSSGFFMVWFTGKYAKLTLLAIGLQWAETARHWPNLTAYTPVWMQPRQTLYRRMNDSSLTYCHDARIYAYFLHTHPEYRYPPALPAAGKFALRLSDCNSYMPEGGPLSCWLLQYFTPVSHYKSTILLFNISEKDIQSLPPSHSPPNTGIP